MNDIFEIQVEYENQCDLDCIHCSSMAMRSESKRGFQTNDLLHLTKLVNKNVNVVLSGGEPLKSPTILMDISKLSNNDNNYITIYSCGAMYDNNKIRGLSHSFSNELKDAGLRKAYISVYGLECAEHESITKVEGSYSAMRETVSNLIFNGVEVAVHLVLMRTNLDDIVNIIQTIISWGVSEVRLLQLVKHGAAINVWDKIGLDYHLQNHAMKDIIKNKESFKARLTISGFPELAPCRSYIDSIACQAEYRLIYISFNGDVFPCACTKSKDKFRIGHISQQDTIVKHIANLCGSYRLSCLNPQKGNAI